MFVFTILQMKKEHEANHYSCSYNRAAWIEEREDKLDQLELASLVCAHHSTNGEVAEGESLLLLL